MLAAALHIRADEITQVDARPWFEDDEDITAVDPHQWWQRRDGDTQSVSHGIGNGTETTSVPVSQVSPAQQLSCNNARLTPAQALYAVLWQGHDARDVRRWL